MHPCLLGGARSAQGRRQPAPPQNESQHSPGVSFRTNPTAPRRDALALLLALLNLLLPLLLVVVLLIPRLLRWWRDPLLDRLEGGYPSAGLFVLLLREEGELHEPLVLESVTHEVGDDLVVC